MQCVKPSERCKWMLYTIEYNTNVIRDC